MCSSELCNRSDGVCDIKDQCKAGWHGVKCDKGTSHVSLQLLPKCPLLQAVNNIYKKYKPWNLRWYDH
jgi:hypothetical protein